MQQRAPTQLHKNGEDWSDDARSHVCQRSSVLTRLSLACSLAALHQKRVASARLQSVAEPKQVGQHGLLRLVLRKHDKACMTLHSIRTVSAKV
jgi:hypothetical protein